MMNTGLISPMKAGCSKQKSDQESELYNMSLMTALPRLFYHATLARIFLLSPLRALLNLGYGRTNQIAPSPR